LLFPIFSQISARMFNTVYHGVSCCKNATDWTALSLHKLQREAMHDIKTHIYIIQVQPLHQYQLLQFTTSLTHKLDM
jgi:hypothetical protein